MVSLMVLGSEVPALGTVLCPPVLDLIGTLHERFAAERVRLLLDRRGRRDSVAAGATPVPSRGLSTPVRLRSVGPVLDLEDGRVPTWDAVVGATVGIGVPAAVRPRGLHLAERHLEVGDESVPAAIVDLALAFSAWPESLPVVSVPKLESAAEARWWRSLVVAAADLVHAPAAPGVQVLLETLPGLLDGAGILDGFGDLVVDVRFDPVDHRASLIREFAESVPQRLQGPDGVGTFAAAAAEHLRQLTSPAPGDIPVTVDDLRAVDGPDGALAETAVRDRVHVVLDHVVHAVGGCGSTAGAAAELARCLLWQWQVDRVMLDSRRVLRPTTGSSSSPPAGRSCRAAGTCWRTPATWSST
jgi:hypothetical protein